MNAPFDHTAIARRATVEDVVEKRNAALESYRIAHQALAAAAAAITDARGLARECGPLRENRFSAQIDREKIHFHYGIRPPEFPDYMVTAQKIVDVEVWARVIEMTDLQRLMDKTARDQFAQQLIKDPPEVTVDNIMATLETVIGSAGMMFKRGIATCFSNLDRRFRSHDGWRIGGRVVLTNAFTEYGSWNYHRDHEATFSDIERVFRVLDDKPSSACEILEKTRAARSGHDRQQSFIETEYFRVRTYMNGNAHIWFKRDDLLDKVNQLLGEYYGAPIPEDREPEPDTGLHDSKTLPAKRDGEFFTPEAAAARVLDAVPLYSADGRRLSILEPSAGVGNLASLFRGHDVDCIEVQPKYAAMLRGSGRYRSVLTADFLSVKPDPNRLYDRIVMNPPFDRERDIDHVLHALKFLKPDGCLVAIMSAGTEVRDTKKSTAFRALIKKMGGRFTDLPPGSFAESGTYCNTIILKVWNNGRDAW